MLIEDKKWIEKERQKKKGNQMLKLVIFFVSQALSQKQKNHAYIFYIDKHAYYMFKTFSRSCHAIYL